MANQSVIDIRIQAKDMASGAINGASNNIQSFGKNALKVGGIIAGALTTIGVAAVGAGKAFVEMSQQAGAITQVSADFDTLAESIDSTASDSIAKLRDATRGMASDFDLMQIGNSLLVQGLAQTDDQMANVVKIADRLGNQTLSTTDRVSEFSSLLRNQSIELLDSFGISGGVVRERIQELQKEFPEMAREVAFTTATMEQAEEKMNLLGAATDTAADPVRRMQAQFQNLKDDALIAIAPVLTRIGEGVESLINDFLQGEEPIDRFRGIINSLRDAFESLSNNPIVQFLVSVAKSVSELTLLVSGITIPLEIAKGFVEGFRSSWDELVLVFNEQLRPALTELKLFLDQAGLSFGVATGDTTSFKDILFETGRVLAIGLVQGIKVAITVISAIIGFIINARNKFIQFKQTVEVVATAIAQTWNSIRNSVTGAINSIISRINAMIGLINKIPGVNIPVVGGVGGGGIGRNQAGTNNFPGGLTTVGERGPELVALPRGSKIFSNEKSQSMDAGGPTNLTINVGTVDNEERITQLSNRVASVLSQNNRNANLNLI